MAHAFPAELDDLIRRNRLLMATAAHAARDTVWLLGCLETERVRSQVAWHLAAIRAAHAAMRRQTSGSSPS